MPRGIETEERRFRANSIATSSANGIGEQSGGQDGWPPPPRARAGAAFTSSRATTAFLGQLLTRALDRA